MCGICGIVGSDDCQLVRQMNERVIHRGPDNIGIWSGDSVCLGHTRLSIIDTSSAGHQPMSNEDDTIWITYNGEIYNFKELKKGLESKGHRFKSRTDTEVIIHLYEEYGEECLEYLRGMFSFAIWDVHKKKLFAARDRLGIKPFFYFIKDNIFMFSSELRPMLVTGLVDKHIDERAVYDYFLYGSVQAPYTMIRNISQLLPGRYLIFEKDKLNIKRYWKIDFSETSDSGKSEAEHISEVRSILSEAIRIRLISDVNIGAFLSGGIDSSIVVGLMQKYSSKPVSTFSVVFEEKSYDEREFSNKIAERFGTTHRQILLKEKDILKEIPTIFDSMDQPSMDGFNTFIISKAVKKAGLKVALSGLGGDELFAGYALFKTLPEINNLLKWTNVFPKSIRDKLFFGLKGFIKNKKMLKTLFAFSKCKNIYDLYILQRALFLPHEIEKILIGSSRKNKAEFITDKIESNRLDSINILSFLELNSYLQNTLLQDTDRMSMAHSLEVRVPFLDHKLIEEMFRIPGTLKSGNDFPKRLLVKAAKDFLPEEVYKRPKKGFVLPFDKWLKSELKDYCEERFSIKELKKIPLLNYAQAKKVWIDFSKGSKLYNYSSILSLLSFINWYKKHFLR